jgi:hypothetical protein
MEKHQNDKTNTDQTLDALHEIFNAEISEQLDGKLNKMLEGFQEDLREHPHFSGQPWRRFLKWLGIFPFSIPMLRFLLLSGTGMACLAFIIVFLFGNKSPTWADVEEQFRTIPFCTVSLYYGGKYFGGYGKLQYWISSEGKVRVHFGDKVAFMDLNIERNFRTFDVVNRNEGGYCHICKDVFYAWHKVKRFGGLTLTSLIESMTGEHFIEPNSIVISNTEFSKDLMIFDAESFDTLWNIRIWALRESKLPIRILKWHRRYDRYEEVLFSYSNSQPDEFFNADSFASKLRDPAYTEHDLKNMFLKSPMEQNFSTHGS